MSVRADDGDILDECHRRTGIGTRHQYKGQSGEQVARWMIQSRPHCNTLVSLLQQYPLRAKKKDDFEVWTRAVQVQDRIRSGRADNSEVIEEMAALKAELAIVRRQGL